MSGVAMNDAVTPRSELRRLPKRGSHDTAAIYPILDAAFLAHVGFVIDGQPFVIPTLYGRDGDTLFLHGSSASRMLRTLDTGVAACVTVTLVDGLVLARSAFHHSMNYRSVVAFGTARKIEDVSRKTEALRAISDHLIAGRWNDVREPTAQELKATAVLEFAIEEASAKVRTGPPVDDEEDYARPAWAGVLPLALTARAPVADPRLAAGVEAPEYVRRYGVRGERGERGEHGEHGGRSERGERGVEGA
jgi:nitroimidazol reductase NimA-like FMN-containing flavoprotein (pyridoxamine 5'-phosphate oxidase superfamily)